MTTDSQRDRADQYWLHTHREIELISIGYREIELISIGYRLTER